jgi:hypothetical protein
LIEYPSKLPRIVVITIIGIRDFGSFQPIRIALGNNTRNETTIPFNIGLHLDSIDERKYPIMTHIVKAEMLASQVSFIKIIGITSIIPATAPSKIPNTVLFICFVFACHLTVSI